MYQLLASTLGFSKTSVRSSRGIVEGVVRFYKDSLAFFWAS